MKRLDESLFLCMLSGFDINRLILSLRDIFRLSSAIIRRRRHIKIWPWRIWWNIYATRMKYWSLNLKSKSCAWAARFGITSAGDQFNSRLLFFLPCVPPTFLQGLVHVFVSCVRSVKKPDFWRDGRNVLGWRRWQKCLCLQARAATFPAGRSWSSCWKTSIRSTERVQSCVF